MPKEFKVVRYGYTYKRDGKTVTSNPLYSTFAEAKEGAKIDRKHFPAGKAKPVEIDITSRVDEWINSIAYAARSETVTIERTEDSIRELIQFIQRGH